MFHLRNTDMVRAVTFQPEQPLVLKFRPGVRLQWRQPWDGPSPFLPCHPPYTPTRKGVLMGLPSPHTQHLGAAGMGVLRAGNTRFVPMLNLSTLPQTELRPGQILASVPSHPPAHQSMHPQPHLEKGRSNPASQRAVHRNMGSFCSQSPAPSLPRCSGPPSSSWGRQKDTGLLHHQATIAHRLPTQQLCEMTTSPNIFLKIRNNKQTNKKPIM